MSTSAISRFSDTYYIVNWNEYLSWFICGLRSKFLYSISSEVMYCCRWFILKVLWLIYLWGCLFVQFHYSTDKFHFVIEDILDKIKRVVLLIKGQIKSQGLVFWVQFFQLEDSWQMKHPKESQIRFQYLFKW